MLKPLLICIAAFLFATTMNAQTNISFALWPNGAPGALGTAPKDVPTLTVFLPDPARATGAAMVICPGGAYQHLADHEGKNYALWLNQMGIAGFVLKYRLGTSGYRHPAMLQDAARALRTVRARAAEWGVNPKSVGIIGSSAGGHLASTLMTHFDASQPDAVDPIERVSSRPDFAILCYPVITMGEFANQGSKTSLLGPDPSPELVKELSNELHVTYDTPPCFIWTTYEDQTVAMENSMMFAAALRRAHVPFDFHVYQHGAHGMGLGSRDDPDKRHPWTRDCEFWLKGNGYAK
jgi:acetyl esterase/lipase